MIPTVAEIRDIFDRFNVMIFGGRLPRIPVCLTRARGYLGLLSYSRVRNADGSESHDGYSLSVSVIRDYEKSVIEDTVIHEMIHLHILVNGFNDTSCHGRIFRMIMNDINHRFGRNISVRHTASEEEKQSDLQIRAHYVCRVRMADGGSGVIVAQKTAIINLWNDVENSDMVAGYRWFGTINPFFNRYSRSRRLRKYFPVDDETLDKELATASPLLRDGDVIRVSQDNRRRQM